MSDMSVNLTGGELTDKEMATLMETGIACEEECKLIGSHVLYRQSDIDVPECIKDRATGEMVLGMCRNCGAAEAELDEDCQERQKRLAAADAELMNPVTGAIVNVDDIDSLILGCDECKRQLDELNAFYRTLREAAWSKTTGTTKTRRLKGRKYQAKVVQGDVYPVGAILKEAWNAYPQFAPKYLRIGKIDPQMREVAKLKGMTSDDPAFVQFKGMIEDALTKGTEGLPVVSLEHGESEG